MPKESGRFDLPIALGILAASQQIPATALDQYEYAGELALTGELRPVHGALAMAIGVARAGHAFVLPNESAQEAALYSEARVFAADSLLQVCAHLSGREPLPRAEHVAQSVSETYLDLRDVKGQEYAKRALEVAAAGGHSILMMGPPGTGKTMLAERLAGILPPMTETEALETAAIQSIGSGGFQVSRWRQRPYRSPHHTASAVALVGGGSNPRPGEISMALNGVLFLDELPEFDRKVLEVLREPLESGRITVSRAARQADFPARFQLIAAMNPCPCGFLGHHNAKCRCTPDQVLRYRHKISGPLLDRIDLHIEVPAVAEHELTGKISGEASPVVRARVSEARARQQDRQGKPNAALDTGELELHGEPDHSGQQLLKQAISRLGLSARAYHRILKVARSIADLAGEPTIVSKNVAEAVQYRRMEVR